MIVVANFHDFLGFQFDFNVFLWNMVRKLWDFAKIAMIFLKHSMRLADSLRFEIRDVCDPVL